MKDEKGVTSKRESSRHDVKGVAPGLTGGESRDHILTPSLSLDFINLLNLGKVNELQALV